MKDSSFLVYFELYLHENRALLWGIIFLERFLDRVPLWNFLDVQPIVPMDTVVFCMFERMVSIARYSVVFSIPMAKIDERRKKWQEIIDCSFTIFSSRILERREIWVIIWVEWMDLCSVQIARLTYFMHTLGVLREFWFVLFSFVLHASQLIFFLLFLLVCYWSYTWFVWWRKPQTIEQQYRFNKIVWFHVLIFIS